MKKRAIILIILLLVILAISIAIIQNKQEITNFEQCLAAGNPAMESYPRQCRAGDKTFVEEIGRTSCEPEQRNADACITLYDPVCVEVQVQCITTPCNPVKETYSNSCNACSNENVLYWESGEC
jgi:hypothetical protein